LDLYLDAETEKILKAEASRFELSSSALIRVLAVIWKEDIFQFTVTELREHIHEIVLRENRKV